MESLRSHRYLLGREGTVDGTHPNDLGLTTMARALEPLPEDILKHI